MSSQLSQFVGFLRIKHIIGDPKAKPPIPPIIPVSASTWWEGVRQGRYPKPIRHGGMTMWRFEDIAKLAEKIVSDAKNNDSYTGNEAS